MSKNTLVLIGGNGKMGNEFQKYLKNEYDIIIFDKKIQKKNSNHFQIDLEKEFDFKKSNLKKKYKNIIAIVNLLRVKELDINDPKYTSIFINYSKFLEEFILYNKIKKCNVINISSINTKLVSQQSYSYHFFKMNLELLTKYFSVKFLKKNILFNDLRVGLIKTKNIDKIISKRNLSRILNIGEMLSYKKLINFIDKVYFHNSILNGTCLTLDNTLSNFDQIYFNNLGKK
jgi:hypothetical protein